MDLQINKILELYEKTLSEYYRKIVVLTLENEEMRNRLSELITERDRLNRELVKLNPPLVEETNNEV